MNIFRKVISFYVEGFRTQSRLSRKLWLIIIIKLFIMFAVLKLFFFPDFLNSRYNTEEQKSNHVINQLTGKND
jgi:hypothetical protein